MSEIRNVSVEEEEEEEEDDDDENEECIEIVGDKNQNHTTCIKQWDDDIIDISELDMEDEQTWLFNTNKSELSFDIGSWLQQDYHVDSIESDSNIINDNNEFEVGSTIDTRTFTRSKKKMSKLNLDSIRERALSTLMYNDDDSGSNKIKINWKEEETRNEDCIPAMLRQSSVGILPPVRVNAQESLEAFLNISQSKGIDSFINMAEPEFNESLMNISRPSFLHTTLGITNNIAMADSQILTDSMMQTSMFNDVDNDNFPDDLENNSFNNRFNSQPETMHRNWLDSSTATTSKSISLLRHDDDDESFTPIKCQEKGVEIFSNTDHQQESFTVNKTFDRLPSDSACLSNTITVEDGLKIFHTTTTTTTTPMEAMNSTQTFDSNSTFSKISLNSTFKCHEIYDKSDIVVEEMNENTSSNSTYVTSNDDEMNFSSTQYTDIKCQTNWPNKELADTQNDEPKSLDMTYSKRDLEGDLILENDGMMVERAKLSTDLPVNRYQTYRKSTTVNKIDLVNKLTANPVIGKMSLNYVKNYQGKSMEMLNKVSGSIPLYSQDIIDTRKLNGPKSLARLPQTLQKSNPNLPSHNSTVARGKTKKIIQQSKFGFQSATGRAILKNGQPKIQGECEKLETRNSNDSISSTLSTYSGPDYDDGLSTCSDGNRHHLICQETGINSEHVYKIARMQEEKLNQESTPKSDRKILDNTWIASDKDLPSPILKNNEIIGKQVVSCCSNSIDSEIQTSSPLLSPAESLQSFPVNEQNHTADQGEIIKPRESLPLNKLSSVFKPPQNLESKTDAGGVRLPISRSSNLPSGIPRPASRIPAPRFSRTNAQIKSQNNLKKSLF